MYPLRHGVMIGQNIVVCVSGFPPPAGEPHECAAHRARARRAAPELPRLALVAMSLFVPYRALGLVAADDVAFVVNRRGTESWVTVPLRDSFVVYDCAKLRVTFFGPRFTQGDVSALATRKNWTFCAVGRDIMCVKRLHVSCALAGGHATRVTRMFVFGFYLVSVDEEGVVKVWDIDDDVMAVREREYEERRLRNDDMDAEEASESASASGVEARDVEMPDGFVTTAIAHPDGYIDKLVFGAADGRMMIMNIRVGKVVYEFAGYGSAVRIVENSPAEDVVAVGLEDGRVLLVDVSRDKVMFTLSMDSTHTPVTAMAFRTDGQDDVLCVGDARGRVMVWDLGMRKIRTLINEAHEGRVSALSFLDGQPVMVSSGGDNTLKEWIFDREDGDARLLRFRAGHSKPPTNVTFYGEGKKLLAAGSDRTLRIFHPFADQQNAEFSQKNTSKRARKMGVAEEELKLPPVTRIAWGELRENDWANVVTAHENSTSAYTWRLSKNTIGEHVLQCPKEDGKCAVTSVCISACGNFAFVGVANGAVHRFNLQSGSHRGALERSIDASAANQRKKKKNGNEGYNFPGGKRSFWALANQASGNKSETLNVPAHDGNITCIAADSANRYMVTAGVDGVIRVWKFSTMKLDMEINVGHATTCGYLHRESSLFAVGCTDKIVRIYDVVTGKRVRTYEPRGDIADVGDVKSVEISVDGRWVFALDSLGSLRVYDIPASRLVQHLILGDDKVTAVSFSPAQDFLVTTHENRRGLYLWVNRVLFEGTKKLAYGRKVSVGLPERMALPDENGTVPEGENGRVQEDIDHGVYIHPDDNAEDDEEFTMEELEEYFEKMSAGPRQIAPGMITLARLPQTHIDTLLNLDVVQEKMKPKQEEKALEQAPFFLPTAAASDDVRRSIFDPIRESEVNKDSSALALVAGDVNSGDPQSRILRQGTALAGAHHTPLLTLLQKGEKAGDYTDALDFLKDASPVVVDGEIRSLGPWDHNFMSSDDRDNLKRGIVFFTAALESGMYFEMVNAHLQVFLKAHSTAIMSSDELKRACHPLRLAMHKSWTRLDDLFNELRCSLSFHTGQHGV